MKQLSVIVIGSNSTRCVTMDTQTGATQRRRTETRLFLHMRDSLLSPDAIAETAEGIARLAGQAGPPLLGVYATSAVRDARNADALARAIEQAAGLTMTVLTGEEEAAASFCGAAGEQAAGVIDIGGGSTEIALGRDLRVSDAISLQLGASRLFKVCPIHTPAGIAPALEYAVAALDTLPAPLTAHAGIDRFYLVGGTGTACARLKRRLTLAQSIEGTALTRDEVYGMLCSVAAVPREKRGDIPGFPPTRADILPTGMAILTAVMDKLRIRELSVTERCNADGLLLCALRKKSS